jgi:phage tail sheath protein FI
VAGALAAADFRARVGGIVGQEYALLRGGLAPQGDITDAQQRILNRHGINVLRRVNEHAALLGDVTLAGDRSVVGAWAHLNHRRLALFVTDSLQRYTRWAVTAARDAEALQRLNDQVRTFLVGLMARGALAGSTPARSFFVRTEASASGAVIITVGLALTKHSEFEIIEIRHDGSGCSTRTGHGFEIGAGAA